MVTDKQNTTNDIEQVSNLGDRMQSAEAGTFTPLEDGEEGPTIEEVEINLPGQLLPGDGLRLSNTPEAMPELIKELRKMKGMTQAELGEAIGYPAPVIGNIEQGTRKLGLKTLGDLFNALGGDLYIEYRQK